MLPVGSEDLVMANTYLSYVKKSKMTRHEQPEVDVVSAISNQQRKQGRKIIFYAGINDHAGVF